MSKPSPPTVAQADAQLRAPAPLPPPRRAAGCAAPGFRRQCRATAPRACTRRQPAPRGGSSAHAGSVRTVFAWRRAMRLACDPGGTHPRAGVQRDSGPVPIGDCVCEQPGRRRGRRFAEEVDERRQQLRLKAPRRAAAAARRRRRAPCRRPQRLRAKAVPGSSRARQASATGPSSCECAQAQGVKTHRRHCSGQRRRRFWNLR